MTLKETIKQNPDGLIAKAYVFAEKAHARQKRESGEPYFNHARATGETLALWRLDETTIAAGLLHDVAEDTETPLADIKKEFGDDVAFLVDGVTKLGHIKYRGAETKVENLRKMILAISEDLRVIFIKLADRLHNMKTLAALAPPKQKRVALETSEIYAPIAYRLGMQNVSGELHDLAFPYLYPKESKWLRESVSDEYAVRRKYLEKLEPVIRKELQKNELTPAFIDFRAKRYHSLYQKLIRHNMDIANVYDLVAMRIIMETVSDCYAALGIIHQLLPPLPGRIKDYIALPKPNGYRSLHTTVIGPDEKFIEIQIRTQEMHDEAENGIAAHWIYEEKKSGAGRKKRPHEEVRREITWVAQLRRWWDEHHAPGVNPDEFVASMKIDFFKDRIFTITPKGDVIDLPAGATPIDFAYQIHSQVGDECVGAKVNDKLVSLGFELHSRDVVEILMQKNKKPSEDWLGFVKTALAREHIRSALKRKDHALRGRLPAGRQGNFPAKTELRIVADDRIGLLKDISGVIARSHVNILNAHSIESPGSKFHINKIQCALTDKKKIEKLVLKLKQIDGVREVSSQLI